MIIRNEERRQRVLREEIDDAISNGGNPLYMYKATMDSIEEFKKELDNLQAMKVTQMIWHHIADLELLSEILRKEYMQKQEK